MKNSMKYLAAAAISLTLLPISAPAFAKDKITFAAAVFAEAGRGDRVKAWIQRFNESQGEVEVEPIAIPFSSKRSSVRRT